MKKIFGFGAAIFMCATPLLGAFIYTNGPEWVRLSNGTCLVMSTILIGICSLVAAVATLVSVYDP